MANATSDKQCLFLTYPEIKKSKVLIVMFVTLSIWNGILLLFALVANALVCTAILKSKELRIRASNTLLLLLSVSDYFVSFTTQPMYLVRRLLELQDRYICWVIVAYRVLWHLSIGTSFLAICFIACERYIALFFTFSYKQIITTPRSLLSIGFSVASWAAFVFSRFLGLSTQHYYAVAISFIIILVSIITLVYVRIYRLQCPTTPLPDTQLCATSLLYSCKREQDYQNYSLYCWIGVYLLLSPVNIFGGCYVLPLLYFPSYRLHYFLQFVAKSFDILWAQCPLEVFHC